MTHKPFREEDHPDPAPDPSLAELCGCDNDCGTDVCVCGEPIRRHAGHWWHCHGAKDHTARPVVTA